MTEIVTCVNTNLKRRGRPKKYYNFEEKKLAEKEYNKNYYQSHKEQMIRRIREIQLNNPERVKEQNKLSYLKNREKILEAKRKKNIFKEILIF